MTDPERRNLEKPDRRAMLPRFGGRRATDPAPRHLVAPRCPGCRHRTNGIGGCCAFDWCRCDCVAEVENAKKRNENADRPPLENTPT